MLPILYEDDSLVFINKPAGLLVQHSTYVPDEPYLEAMVAEQVGPVFLMQRLDRGTSGVIFFSKRTELNARLTRQFEKKRIQKHYLAICTGELRERQTIDAPLARIGAIKFGVREHGKRAITHVVPRAATSSGSFLAIRLETGRTHQIRVHLAAIGHPLAGDWLYGKRDEGRPMLHAAELEMLHPLTGQPLRVSAPVPDDFKAEAARRGIELETTSAEDTGDRFRVQLSD
jgi:23S rRNA pseudouridine1911/1915/1917 synthase